MKFNIMIADDHAIFRNCLKMMLENEGNMSVCLEAADGAQVIDKIRRAEVHPDVLLLDDNMPKMSGIEVAKKLANEAPDIAIIILTMHDDVEYLEELLKVGVRAFILKRSSEKELNAAIQSVMRGEQYIDSALTHLVVQWSMGQSPTQEEKKISLLSNREDQVCRKLVLGHTNEEIAEILCISKRTVEMHRNNIMSKIGAVNRADLVRYGIDQNYFEK